MTAQYRHVVLDERVQIELWIDQGVSQAEIARRLGRHRSTVSREVRRRSWLPANTSAAYVPYRPAGLKTRPATRRQYRASQAQRYADAAKTRSHQPHRMRYDRLVDWVITHLRKGWTPQEISGRLPIEFPGDPRMRVGVETLYAWIYAPAQRHRQLWQYLPRGQRRRRKRQGRRVHAERIKWRTSIHDRPAEVDERVEFGHWEADSVLGARGSGGIHSSVERVSRYLVGVKIPTITAQATLDAQLGVFAAMPAHAVRSVTTDNGSEFALHHRLADTLAVPTYFADPYSSWQRGTNEHFNGRIRKYLPKGTSFAELDQAELDAFITEINNRPRKVLDWATPAEVFQELSSSPATTRCTTD